jgi:inosine triphosphate pyrophosphatase
MQGLAKRGAALTFVTGNANKLRELSQVLGDTVALRNEPMDLPEYQGTPEYIVERKVLEAVQRVQGGGGVLVEDTCLAFDALGGMPGPYVKWFLDAVGASGLHRMLAGFDNKKAKAICTFGYCAGPGQEVLFFQGIETGTIVEPRGAAGFGWDPIFQPDHGEGQTYAEMSAEAKNAISHRGRATQKLKAHFSVH